MRNSLYSITLEDAISHIGGHHRYQLRLFFTCSLVWTVSGIIVAAYGLHRNFERQPFAESFHDGFCEALLWTGLAVGASGSAYISGRVGRKLVMTVSQALVTISLLLTSVSSPYDIFLVLSASNGVFLGGVLTSSYLLLAEIVDSVYRPVLVGSLLALASTGTVLAAGLFYLVGWQLAFATLGVIGVFPVFLLRGCYESPRFLAASAGKYSQARHITNFIAIHNRRLGFSETLEGEKVVGYQETREFAVTPKHGRKYSFIPVSSDIVTVSYAELESIKKYSLLDLYQNKPVRTLLRNLAIASWCCATGFHATSPELSPRLTLLGTALTDISACIITSLVLMSLNRQVWLTLMSLGGSISLMVEIVFSLCTESISQTAAVDYVLVFLAVISRFALVSCVNTLYLLSSEAFATNIRSQSLATIEFCSKLGFFAGYFFWDLTEHFEMWSATLALPLLLLSSKIACSLPETLGEVMEDYLEEDKQTMNQPLELSTLQVAQT